MGLKRTLLLGSQTRNFPYHDSFTVSVHIPRSFPLLLEPSKSHVTLLPMQWPYRRTLLYENSCREGTIEPSEYRMLLERVGLNLHSAYNFLLYWRPDVGCSAYTTTVYGFAFPIRCVSGGKNGLRERYGARGRERAFVIVESNYFSLSFSAAAAMPSIFLRS